MRSPWRVKKGKMGNGRFSDGFMLGALIGGAAVFLLGTKKGNKVLKAITEEGLDGLNDLIEDLEGRVEGTRPVPNTAQKKTIVKTESTHPIEEKFELEPVVEKNGNSSHKRFFKRKN